jgi:hypothetical protein
VGKSARRQIYTLEGSEMKISHLGTRFFALIMGTIAFVTIWQLGEHQSGREHWEWLFVNLTKDWTVIEIAIAGTCLVFFLIGLFTLLVSGNITMCLLGLGLIIVNIVTYGFWWNGETAKLSIQTLMIFLNVCMVVNIAAAIRIIFNKWNN